MSDNGKIVLRSDATVQSIIPLVKRAKDEKRVVKFKIGHRAVHVYFLSETTQQFWIEETGDVSCSPTVIAQAIYDNYMQPAGLANDPEREGMDVEAEEDCGQPVVDFGLSGVPQDSTLEALEAWRE